MTKLESSYSKFWPGEVYPCHIQSQSDPKKILNRGKIKLFGKGFKLSECSDFSTCFYLKQKTFNDEKNGYTMWGKIRDIKKPNYFLSLETEEGCSKIKCGYNGEGDDVKIIIKSADDFGQMIGNIYVFRKDDIYAMKDTDDVEILIKGYTGDDFLIKFD